MLIGNLLFNFRNSNASNLKTQKNCQTNLSAAILTGNLESRRSIIAAALPNCLLGLCLAAAPPSSSKPALTSRNDYGVLFSPCPFLNQSVSRISRLHLPFKLGGWDPSLKRNNLWEPRNVIVISTDITPSKAHGLIERVSEDADKLVPMYLAAPVLYCLVNYAI